MMRQTAEKTRTGMKVLPREEAELELVPDEVVWLRVPPVELSRPEPMRGSSLEF